MTASPRKIGCVIVSHGSVGQSMMDAVQGILGKQTGWTAVSNSGMGLRELADTVARAIEELSANYDVVVFSDMPGGSCHHACQETVGEAGGVHVIAGLNLMMLLEFFVKRDRTSLDNLLELVLERGRDAIRLV